MRQARSSSAWVIPRPIPLEAPVLMATGCGVGVLCRNGDLRIGGIFFAAKFTGQRQLHLKEPVFAVNMAMTAARCGDFGGI
jgi:hypothetical protein